MKIGDKVRSTKVRPTDTATIIKSNVRRVRSRKDDNKVEIRTEYLATFDDGKKLKFYGFNINKTIFKVEENGQMKLSDFMDMKGVI